MSSLTEMIVRPPSLTTLISPSFISLNMVVRLRPSAEPASSMPSARRIGVCRGCVLAFGVVGSFMEVPIGT